MRLRLDGASGLSLALLTDGGGRLTSGQAELSRTLQRGRYVVAVRAATDGAGGRYRLQLVVRNLTRTTLSGPGAELAPGAWPNLRVATTPAPDGGTIRVQVDRFDPLDGWQFARIINMHASGGTVPWRPPALGRWRVRASYLGTTHFSPSRSGYVNLLVATPLAL